MPQSMDGNNIPAWGSYLYQNFLLPAFSPSLAASWLTSPFSSNVNQGNNDGNNNNEEEQEGQRDGMRGDRQQYGQDEDKKGIMSPNINDYFGSWQVPPQGLPQDQQFDPAKSVMPGFNLAAMGGYGIQAQQQHQQVMAFQQFASQQQQQQQQPPPNNMFNPSFQLPQSLQPQQQNQQQNQAGPSSFYPQPYYPPTSFSIATSLLANVNANSNPTHNSQVEQIKLESRYDAPTRPPPQPLTVDPSSFNNQGNPRGLDSAHHVSALLYPKDRKRSRDGEMRRDSSGGVGPSGTGTPNNRISPTSLEARMIDDLVPAVPLSSTPSPMISSDTTPHHSPRIGSPKKIKRERCDNKKRHDSLIDSEHEHDHDEHDHEHSDLDHDHEVPEGVERDGMIWGMKVEDYRALSARERKRVRNRISARTFRAKRKEHLNVLESTLGEKDLQVKLSREEAVRLRREVEDLKRRLSKYERV